MISRILPGLRHVRTPLIVGYMWFAAVWLMLHDRFPTESEAKARYPAFDSLLDFAGSTGTVVVLSFVAYLVGSLNLELISWLRDNLYPFAYTLAPFLRLQHPAIQRRVSNEAAGVDFASLPLNRLGSSESVAEKGQSKRDPDKGDMTDIRPDLMSWGVGTSPVSGASAPEYQLVDVLTEELADAEARYASDLEAQRELEELAYSVGDVPIYIPDKPERQPEDLLVERVWDETERQTTVQRLLVASEGIHTEYDRLASESEMRLAIVAPLIAVAIAAVIALRWSVVGEIVLLAATGVAAFLIWLQGQHIQTQADTVLKNAVATGVVNTETLDLLEAVKTAQSNR
jgi:hypothetical protein